MNNENYIVYLHWCGFSHKELHKMYEKGRDFNQVYNDMTYESVSKIVTQQKRIDEILKRRRSIQERELDRTIEVLGVQIVLYSDTVYPEGLKHISHPPFILYIRGDAPGREGFAVVGSRKISSYGKRVIHSIVPEISEVFAVVSGGAAGCDTEAHRSCVQSGNKTIVVMGTGIDKCYPATNSRLFEEIIQKGGTLVSSFRIGEPGNPYNFPMRNEIVVGLSRGVFVVEAQEKSGSLITSGLALEYGKDLFVTPGDIFSKNSVGTNMLIQRGEAKLVLSSIDILEEYNTEVKKKTHKSLENSLNPEEKKVYDVISEGNHDFDKIFELSEYETRKLLGILSLLEIKGYVKKDLRGSYVLS